MVTGSIEQLKNECQFCGEGTHLPPFYVSMCMPIPEMEEKMDKWGRENWWENIERKDLSEKEIKELDDISTYDQLLSTVGKGYCCTPCNIKADELFNKYYPQEGG